tara:strand:- start:102055 stop:104529 length:2475 start_codon:yes stop_codon:yes gene_type:complete
MQQADNEVNSQLPPLPAHGFISRTEDTKLLEDGLTNSHVISLVGEAGIGKTELALDYARTSEERNLYPGGVIYSQVTVGSSFQKLLHEAGSSFFGITFGELDLTDQVDALKDYFSNNGTLLIWDDINYCEELWESGEVIKLKTYLSEIDNYNDSRILLLSRNAESITNIIQSSHIIEIDSMGKPEFNQLASTLIQVNDNQDLLDLSKSDLSALLSQLQGHPLALQIILPLLKSNPISVIQQALQEQVDSGSNILRSAFEVFYERASYRIRTHLPVISLFKKRIMLDVLTHFTQSNPYKTVMKEELGWGATRALLRSSKDSGVLTSISPSVYQIPASVPPLLGEKLYLSHSSESVSKLEQEFTRIYIDTADHFLESLDENPDSGTTAILAEEENFYQALGLALESQDWEGAQILMQPVAQVYKMQKRFLELDLLKEQLLGTIGLNAANAIDNNAIELWEYIKGTTSTDLIEQNKITEATEICHELLDYLENNQPENKDLKLATVYGQLGEVHLITKQLEISEEYFDKANSIYTSLEANDNSAEIFQHIGRIRYFQGRYSDAKTEYSKALEIHQQSGDEEQMVVDYRFLGLLSQLQLNYDEAESWYKQAQSIAENYGDEETAMLVYHDLGTVFHAQYYFEEAQSWYRQALHLADRLGLQAQMAREFHYLGLLSQDRGELHDEAEEWLTASLEIKTQLQDHIGSGDECRQIGLLYHEQENFNQAEEWYKKAIDFFQQASSVDRLARTYGQMGIIKQEQGDTNGSLEWAARTYTLVNNNKLPMIDQVINHLSVIRNEIGETTFDKWWEDQFNELSPVSKLSPEDDQNG